MLSTCHCINIQVPLRRLNQYFTPVTKYKLFIVSMSCLHSYLLFKTATDGREEQIELGVFNFSGAGGVALSMYNTDEVS